MNSKEAASYLGYAEITLRVSRVTGMLAETITPPYIKQGKRIIYDEKDLDIWRSQFKKITNTTQTSLKRS